MSRHPYFVLSDFVSWACKFRMHETRIVEPGFEFPLHGPVCEIEQGLAGASHHLWQLFDEYNAGIAELTPNPFSLPLRRAVEPVLVLIESRLRSWEWNLSFLRTCLFDGIEAPAPRSRKHATTRSWMRRPLGDCSGKTSINTIARMSLPSKRNTKG